jgi:phosphoglycolate phosphatase
MRYDGIILDVDGTIWDSTSLVALAWNRALADSGRPDRHVDSDLLKSLFGKTMKDIMEVILPDEDEDTRDRVSALCFRYENEMLSGDDYDIAYPGVAETIKEMSRHIPFFIVSNCQEGYIEELIRRYSLKDYIKDFEDYGRTGFGKADNIKLLVSRNSLESPVYVGDTAMDQKACHEAGVPFIFASYGFGTAAEDECDMVIDRFSDLTGLLN